MFGPPNSVIRDIDGTWVQLALNGTTASATEPLASCSRMTGDCPTYWFAQIDCQGPSYMSPASNLVQEAIVVEGEIRFRAGPVALETPKSFTDGSLQCGELGGTQMDLAETKSVPLSSLGLTAPFHVAR